MNTWSQPERTEALLTHTEWVRALARSLVRPDESADDVVQETWITVLEHPPRPEGNLRGWLATVVRNVVRQTRRSEARRHDREEAAARREEDNASAAAGTVVERAELHRRMVNTVMKLEEPYRTAILLRYFENLPPREIARQTGVEPETARSRVRRALTTLRARLDDAWGDRSAWVSALAPLLATPAGGVAAASATTAAAAGGGAVLSLEAKVVLAGVAAAPLATGVVIVPPLFESTADRVHTTAEAPPPVQPPPRHQPGKEPTGPSGPEKGHPAPDRTIAAPGKPPAKPAVPPGPARPGAPSPASSNTNPGRSSPPPAAPNEGAPDRNAAASPLTRPVFRPAEFRQVIRKLARLLHDHEEAQEAALNGDAHQTRKAKSCRKALTDYLAELREKGVNPLKMPELWWHVFSHPDYREFPGRPGTFADTMGWSWMGKKMSVRYHLAVPRSYSPKEPFPVVLCFHPREGDRPGATYARACCEDKRLGKHAILLAPEFPADAPKDASWSDRKMLYAHMGVLGAKVIRCYNADWNRLLLDGYRDSATEVWKLASQVADNFAGVIIRGAAPPAGTRFEDFRHTAFLLVGVPGTSLDPTAARKLARRMKKAGVRVELAPLHQAPEPGQEPVAYQSIARKVAAFVRKSVRDPYPLVLDWSVKESNTRRHFWVRSTGEVEVKAPARKGRNDPPQPAAPPGFRVQVDAGENRLNIQTHRILGLQIFLNDAILDLDRPVTVCVNGRTALVQKPTRSLEMLLEQVTASGDWTRAFPWSCRIQVRKK